MFREKLVISEFVVTGRGRFPIDMLRYDCCVPAQLEDVSKIERSMDDGVQTASRPNQERSIRLRRYAVGSALPTLDRWKSFGWEVVLPIDD